MNKEQVDKLNKVQRAVYDFSGNILGEIVLGSGGDGIKVNYEAWNSQGAIDMRIAIVKYVVDMCSKMLKELEE